MSSNDNITENTDLRVEAVMKKLIEGIVTDEHPSPFLFVLEKVGSKVEELSSKTFGPELLQVMSDVYAKSRKILRSPRKMEESTWDVHGNRCRIQLIVKDAIELQKDIDKLKGDAQRAKEEKVTGKILLACWLGISHEVTQVLAKAIARVVTDTTVNRRVRETRAQCLLYMGTILTDVIDGAPYNAHCPLRRVMAVEGASTHRSQGEGQDLKNQFLMR